MVAAGFCRMRRRRSKITAVAGFLSAVAKDHMNVDLGDVCVGDIKLDDDLNIA
jgi:hypothetical protein